MVYVVPGVPDGHILKHTSVRPKDVVRLRPHILATTEHAPRPAVPITWNLAGEEVLCHILQHLYRHHYCYQLIALVSVQRLHICIEVTCNKYIHTSRPLVNCRNNALQGGVISQSEVADHHILASPARHQIKVGKLQVLLLVGFHREAQRLFV